MWPDVWIKSRPIFSKVPPKVDTVGFNLKMMLSKGCKSDEIFLTLMKDNLLQRTLKNRPIWSHCCRWIEVQTDGISKEEKILVPSAAISFRNQDQQMEEFLVDEMREGGRESLELIFQMKRRRSLTQSLLGRVKSGRINPVITKNNKPPSSSSSSSSLRMQIVDDLIFSFSTLWLLSVNLYF